MKSFSACLWVLAVSVAFLVQTSASPVASAPVVNLGYAQYQGAIIQDKVTNATHTQFLGIRYAAPPTGSLRFRAPALPAVTAGVQQATSSPPSCMQGGDGTSPTTPFRAGHLQSRTEQDVGPSEDCLFLNVFLPGTLDQRKKLPVVVYIHGGGYAAGAAGIAGNDLIRESGEGVVSVLIQYRLGLFGFLPGRKVKEGGSLNAGLLDQQLALKWVQQHIWQFGGDRAKVTIWGTSAGAGSVLQHVVANGGFTFPPLFRAAMTSSTFLPSQYKYNDPIPELLYSEAVSQTNCSSATNTLDCLRLVDVNTLQAANVKISQGGFFGTFVFVPVVDGTFITDRPTRLLQHRRFNGKILYSVTNTFEGVTFVNQSTANTVQVADYVTQLFPNISPRQAKAAAAKYAGLGTNIDQVSGIMGEAIFICPTYYLLRAFGGKAFKGEFAIPPGYHGQDVAYYFTNGVAPPFANPKFDTAFADSFMDFTMHLNPNDKHDPANITPLWQMWQGSNEMLFNKTDGGDAVVQPIKTSTALLDRCNFWQSVAENTAQ
ncbi:alpha/beta-hydrolase [Agrocybe pediades]|nr:alpha/beta-hydrolase [Agrocybe pediades]